MMKTLLMAAMEVLFVFHVHASTSMGMSKFLSSDGEAGDRFGTSVALSGYRAVVGTLGDDDNGPASGSIYVFDVRSDTPLRKLLPADGWTHDWFGCSVGLSGKLAVVGALGNDDRGADSGSAYLFDVTTGLEICKWVPVDGAADDHFGHSVAISRNVVVVGAEHDDDKGPNSGSAYVFDVHSGTQVHKLLAGDGTAGDSFGCSVAVSGNRAVVGADGDDDLGAQSGSAYVFDVSTGEQLYKLLPSDGAPGNEFGHSVALCADRVVVGAWQDDDNGNLSGSVYVFDATTGAQLYKLLPDDGREGDQFGSSVALSGNRALVGARFHPDNGAWSGSAYIFDISTGQQRCKLLPSDRTSGMQFGNAVALSGDWAVAGAHLDNDHGNESGSAYVFDVTFGDQLHRQSPIDGQEGDTFGKPVSVSGTWAVIGAQNHDQNGADSGSAYVLDVTIGALVHELLPSDGSAGDRFGSSVAVSGNRAVVGAPGDNAHGYRSGSAYVFDLSTGARIRKLLPSDGEAYDEFGVSVAADGDRALIAAWGDNELGLSSGSVYVFDLTTGAQLRKLSPKDGAANDWFGSSVALSGDRALIGAYADDDNGSLSGSAYVFDVTTGDQLHKLLPSGGLAGDEFGNAVALSGNRAVVGAHRNGYHGYRSGTAYLFDVTTGAQLHRLLPFDGETGEYFGSSVALRGDWIVVGAYGDNDNGTASGSAYMFEVTTGKLRHKLLPIDGEAGAWFGSDVALSGNRVVVGAPAPNGASSGRVYVFDVTTHQLVPENGLLERNQFGYSVARNDNMLVIGARDYDESQDVFYRIVHVFDERTGAHLYTLPPAGGAHLYGFGQSVAVNRNVVVVGSPLASHGFAYVFDMTTGEQLRRLEASDGERDDQFGASVALSGDLAVIGAPTPNTGRPGSAYVFDVTTGAQLCKIDTATVEPDDWFGHSVAISGNRVLVGAPLQDDNGTNAGRAYVFSTTGSLIRNLGPVDGEEGDRFGWSVALNGHLAVVGAYNDDDIGANSGSAYVFDVTTYEQLNKLLPFDGEWGGQFGYAVSLSGNLAIIGAPNSSVSGSAYVFDAIVGEELQHLLPSEQKTGDRFGYSVALGGTGAIVGAPALYTTDHGSAYVFEVPIPKLLPADGAENDSFGNSVALDGKLAVVGAYGDDDNGANSGSAYVFDSRTGEQLHKLLPTDGAADQYFGVTAALSGDLAVVGAPFDDDNGAYSGSAYIFDMSTGELLRKLLPGDGMAADYFGLSVAVSGNRAVVGAYGDDENGADSGSAYLFDVMSGELLNKLLPPDGEAGDAFGVSVALSENRVLVGAWKEDSRGADSGSVYVFDAMTGELLSKWIPLDLEAGDEFGGQISLSGDLAVIGASNDDGDHRDSGCVYVIDIGSGRILYKLFPPDGAAYDQFGSSVSLNENRVLVGALYDDDNGDQSGSAYLFKLPGFGGGDSDYDGLPDWWEDMYFGHRSGAYPCMPCANGINTLLEAYIAGLDPNNPDSVFRTSINLPGQHLQWSSVSGRVYSVYWTRNLLNGFQLLQNNIPWTQGAYMDTQHGAESHNFYMIDIQLEP